MKQYRNSCDGPT